jgi:penicillin amidase
LKLVGERRFQELLAEYPEDEIFDLPETSQKETAKDIIQQALLSAIDSLNNWSAANHGKEYTWADFKNTTIQHLLPPLAPFTVSGVQIGGNRSIINATSARHGASWRMVVELGSTPTAFGVYPGGQSGNPGSKFYDNMIEIWAKGEYLNLKALPIAEMQQENILFTQIIDPRNE